MPVPGAPARPATRVRARRRPVHSSRSPPSLRPVRPRPRAVDEQRAGARSGPRRRRVPGRLDHLRGAGAMGMASVAAPPAAPPAAGQTTAGNTATRNLKGGERPAGGTHWGGPAAGPDGPAVVQAGVAAPAPTSAASRPASRVSHAQPTSTRRSQPGGPGSAAPPLPKRTAQPAAPPRPAGLAQPDSATTRAAGQQRPAAAGPARGARSKRPLTPASPPPPAEAARCSARTSRPSGRSAPRPGQARARGATASPGRRPW